MKGLLYLTYPKLAMKSLARVSAERAHEFVIAGVVLVAIAVLIGYSLATRGALFS